MDEPTKKTPSTGREMQKQQKSTLFFAGRREALTIGRCQPQASPRRFRPPPVSARPQKASLPPQPHTAPPLRARFLQASVHQWEDDRERFKKRQHRKNPDVEISLLVTQRNFDKVSHANVSLKLASCEPLARARRSPKTNGALFGRVDRASYVVIFLSIASASGSF